MISFRVSRAPDGFPFPNAIRSLRSTLYLSEAGLDKTLVRVVSQGFDAGHESQDMRAFFERGNAATLAQLQQRFAARP